MATKTGVCEECGAAGIVHEDAGICETCWNKEQFPEDGYPEPSYEDEERWKLDDLSDAMYTFLREDY